MHQLLPDSIRRVLAYYDIFDHPLSGDEVYYFLPIREVSGNDVRKALDIETAKGTLFHHKGYYGLQKNTSVLVERRLEMERLAKKRWRTARRMTHILKRFPFVSSVIITGTLSKNIHWPGMDIDYFIITDPGRLWIARTALILFKKIFLLNSKQLFCLNYFVTQRALEIPDKNIFTATEIAHAKVLYNRDEFQRFLNANNWIRQYFPNLNDGSLYAPEPDNKESTLAQWLGSLPARRWLDRLDSSLMRRWQSIWERRYPELSPEKRDALFRVRPDESKAHGPDFQTRILDAYALRCRELGLSQHHFQGTQHEHPAYT